MVDMCSLWVSNIFFMNMNLNQIDFSRVLSDDQVYDHMMASYDQLGSEWIVHQWNWMNNVYLAFKDHYKYLIEKFSITEICEKLQLPKETVRRKVLELEKLGALKRKKKQLVIDRSVFFHVKPERQIKLTSKYIFLVSKIFNKDKIYSKKLDQVFIENIVHQNFSLCWRWFYRMQIPMIIGYHEMFEDLATFHVWGTVAMNQAFNYKKKENTNIGSLKPDYMKFNQGILENDGSSPGISAMSISDMTEIPRATVIRKCKFLINNGFLTINDKKHYVMTGLNASKVLPYQRQIFKNKAKFLRKTLNLLTIS